MVLKLPTLLLALSLTVSGSAMGSHTVEHDKELLGKRLGMDGELAVRIIAMGLAKRKTEDWDARDELVCFFDQTVGSHFTHLLCATNKSLFAGAGEGIANLSATGGNRHHIGQLSGRVGYVIATPMNRGRMERMIDSLGGLPEMNPRLVELGLSGERIPADLPVAEELDRYAAANPEVEALRAAGATDAALKRVIVDGGFTVDRYNRITELVAQHPELFDYVRERSR